MERLSAAFEFPLSENRQQYERLLFPQEYSDIRQRGETVLKQQGEGVGKTLCPLSAVIPAPAEIRRNSSETQVGEKQLPKLKVYLHLRGNNAD